MRQPCLSHAGARAIYLTRYDRYIKDGYDKDTAHRRAIQDAEIGYNLTQQSSEGAFVSAIQKDRTLFSNMWTLFRNSSMSYTRQSVTAVRNLKHLLTDKDKLIDSTTRQMMEDGIEKDQARKNAEAEYKRALWRNGVRLAVNAWIGPLLWEMGSKLPYIFLGDDDEEKKKMAEDALAKELLVGPVEGFVGGQSYNALWGAASSRDVRETLEREGFKEAANEGIKAMERQDTSPLPLFADMGRLLNKFSKDEAAGFQDRGTHVNWGEPSDADRPHRSRYRLEPWRHGLCQGDRAFPAPSADGTAGVCKEHLYRRAWHECR